jgi:hypothetical protein
MLIKDIVINENTYLQQKGFDVLTERPDNLSFLLRYVQNSIKLEVDYFIEERDNEIFVAIYYTDEGTSCVTDKKSFWENYDKKGEDLESNIIQFYHPIKRLEMLNGLFPN